MGSTPPRLERKKLSDQIIEDLVDRIARGELKPGDKLPPEPQLMEQFRCGKEAQFAKPLVLLRYWDCFRSVRAKVLA